MGLLEGLERNLSKAFLLFNFEEFNFDFFF